MNASTTTKTKIGTHIVGEHGGGRRRLPIDFVRLNIQFDLDIRVVLIPYSG